MGGVALFKQEIAVDLFPEFSEKPLRYEFLLYPNPMARAETALPRKFIEGFLKAKAAHAGVPSFDNI